MLSTSRTPPGIRSCPSLDIRRLALAGGGRGRCDVARPAHAGGHGGDVRDRRLQPVPIDHALPQQLGLSRDRARAARGRAAAGGSSRSTPGSELGGAAAPELTAPAWPLWLLRFEASAVYAASGLSKLADPDWFGGTVTWQRVVRARERPGGVADAHWAVSALTDRDFHTGAAKAIVLTELFIAVGPVAAPHRDTSPSGSRSSST